MQNPALSIFVCSLSGPGLAPSVLVNFYAHHSALRSLGRVEKGP